MRFEIYKDEKGEFRFRLVAGNNEIIAVSESYKRKESAVKIINSIKEEFANFDVPVVMK